MTLEPVTLLNYTMLAFAMQRVHCIVKLCFKKMLALTICILTFLSLQGGKDSAVA